MAWRSLLWATSYSVPEASGGECVAFNREHVAEGRLDSVCELMTAFRFYLDYHIKSSKTYIHNRMRNRAEQWKNCESEWEL